jgi:hypothetical protein
MVSGEPTPVRYPEPCNVVPNLLIAPVVPNSYCRCVPFIRVKFIKGREYRYLVEGVRGGGKVRQRVIAYLGEHETGPGGL